MTTGDAALIQMAYWCLAVARGDLPEDSDPDDYVHVPDPDVDGQVRDHRGDDDGGDPS